MCAINPTHKMRLVVDVYTSLPMTKQEFEEQVHYVLVDTEIDLNSTYHKLRFHLKETNQKAD